MSTLHEAAHIRADKSHVSANNFPPIATIKCDGPPVFRSQIARDVACLLDVEPLVSAWSCMPIALDLRHRHHTPDFLVYAADGTMRFVDAPDRNDLPDPESLLRAAVRRGCGYHLLDAREAFYGCRLQNAKDLLRYGNHWTPLGDRVRLLAALSEHGSLTIAECMSAFRETKAMAGLASLILRGFVEVDLDEALIGPESMVRRIDR